VVLTLGRVLKRPQRDEFYRRIAVELAQLQAPFGDGQVYKLAAGIQRELFDAPLDGSRDL
jgi:hypothetical protein